MKNKRYWMYFRIILSSVFILLFILSFLGITPSIISPIKLQLGPAIVSCVNAFSLGACTTIIGIILLTLCFGRIYCSIICPVGMCQDFIHFIFQQKFNIKELNKIPDLTFIRYVISGLVIGLFLFGNTTGFLLFDPYSNFGRLFRVFSLGGITSFLLIFIIPIFKKRFYCLTLCPIGFFLELLSKKSLIHLALTDRCIKCNTCLEICPVKCINPNLSSYNDSACIRCFKCISLCPAQSMEITQKNISYPSDSQPLNISRRKFIIKGGFLLGGLAFGTTLSKTGITKILNSSRKFKILPPGAQDIKKFSSQCISCQLCVKNCPSKIIVPAVGEFGPVSIDFNKGACAFNCNRCSKICPSGAILPISLEQKQRTKIAQVFFNPTNCLTILENKECGKCAMVCPIYVITLNNNGTPDLSNSNRCLGCGSCQNACPANPKAITVQAIEKQILLKE